VPRLAVVAAALSLLVVAGTARAELPARCVRTSACDARVASGGLVIERDDGSRLRVGRTARLVCSAWSSGVRAPSLHLLVGDPHRVRPLWTVSVVRGSLRRRRTFRFPTDVIDDRPRGLVFFADDPASHNELSSQVERASGSVTVVRARCSPRPEVTLRVRAHLGSEFFDRPGARIEGRIRVLGRAAA
jgi:hypothetical protein